MNSHGKPPEAVDRIGPAEPVLARRFADGQRLLTPVTRALMRAVDAEVDMAIDLALAEIGAFCSADRSYVFRFIEQGALVSNTHEWCQTGIDPQIDNLRRLPRSIADPWMPSLENDRVLVVDDVSAIPPGDPLRDVLESQDIRGLVVVPLMDGASLTGFVGFDIVRPRPPFDVVEIGLLRFVADAIGAALARRDAAEAVAVAQRRARFAEAEVERLARVAEVTTNLIVIVDPEQRIVWANPAFERQSGHRLADIAGRDFAELVRGPGSDAGSRAAVREAVDRRASHEGEAVNYAADGSPYWIQFNMHPLYDHAGAYVGHVSVETVISERKALEQEIEARNAFLSAIMRTSVSAIVAMNASGDVVYANGAAQEVLGLKPAAADVAGWLWPDWTPVACDGHPVEGRNLRDVIRAMDPSDTRGLTLVLALPQGARRVLSVMAAPLATALNGADAVLSVSDITALEDTAERLRRLADADPLTGLANRRGLAEAMKAAFRHPAPDAAPCAVVMIDLDNFKAVNDTLRHDGGDAILVEVGRRLAEAAGPGDCVARIGGDEFVVLRRVMDAAAALTFAEGLRAAIARPIPVAGKSITLTASAGVALWPGHGTDRTSLMTGADVALFAAKGAGRNRSVILSQDLYDADRRRAAILGALADDRLDQALGFAVQPIVRADAETRIVGAEILLRWTDPDLGDVAADEFVPVAEQAGLMPRIDRHVLARAVGLLTRWMERGCRLSLNVNVSPHSLSGPGFADWVLDRVRAAGVDPGALVLELTETSPLPETRTARDNVHRLRQAGVGIAIDDFGTGYASLSYLQRIAATELKIDRSFVATLGPEGRGHNAALVRAMIAVARALGLSITAEGVETQAQFDWLRDAGCDRVQGYLTGAPVPVMDFERALPAKLQGDAHA